MPPPPAKSSSARKPPAIFSPARLCSTAPSALGRWRKTCERLREGRLPAPGLAFTAVCDGVLVGTLRFWSIAAGAGRDALLLGPIAISAALRSQAASAQRMIRHGLERARELGHRAVLLVGDAPYYERFGFSRAGAEQLDLPGPVDLARFLALELQPGALDGAQGLVRATGAFAQTESERRRRLDAVVRLSHPTVTKRAPSDPGGVA